MGLSDFKNSLAGNQPRSNDSVYLQALWRDAKGDWDGAHQLIQDVKDPGAAWIHAYLHRKEGDIWNADYWYHKAGKTRPSLSLEDEWEELVTSFL